jgi:HEAT repeat protein
LELLQLRFREHPAAREASQAALASPDAELRFLGARYLGEQGLAHVREIVESEAVPADLRLEGLVHYVLVAPVPEAFALIARVGGQLAEAELPVKAGEPLAKVDDATREPVLLQLLALAPVRVKVAAARGLGRIGTVAAVEPLLAHRDGTESSGELRQAAGEAIAQIQARLGDVEAGRLSVAAPAAAAGGLAVAEADPSGGVSLAGEAVSASTSARRGSERGTDGAPPDT